MKSIQRIIEQAKTARGKVVDHLKSTFKRAGLYALLTGAFYFSIQDSGLLFWTPLFLMMCTATAMAFKLVWGSFVFMVLFRVDGVVEDAQDYGEIAKNVAVLANDQINRHRKASESSEVSAQ